MMTEEEFWRIIDSSREVACRIERRATEDFMEVHVRILTEEMRKITTDEIIQFDRRFFHFAGRAYRNDLWAAAYWFSGGCSDDGFMDFRSSLISLGKTMYFQVLNDPDSIADILDRPNI